MRILLISGHGAGDPGAVYGSYKETDLTIEVVHKIENLLSKYADVTVYPVERNAFQDLKQGKWQLNWDYDYVLEIHFNAGGGTGTEVYVTPQEQRVTVENKILANMELFYRNRGVKRENFLVIQTAKKKGISSALLEVCFIDSENDMQIYQQSKEKICASIVAGIVEGFGIREGIGANPSANEYISKTSYNGNSIVEGLMNVGVNSSYSHREKLAVVNGISGYRGTASQNIQMLNLLKSGKLKKA